LSSVDIKPGATLGRYEILMPVAQGGMAAVWAARMLGSRGFQKIVAIKTMLPDLSDDPDFEAMFLDEARLASRVRHPYVAEILDLGEESDWLYIVMEWVNGETLFVLNKQARAKGGFPLPLLARILSCACAGLHAAHELRDDDGKLLEFVHRDINPQNVMVSYDGIVKLVDFGVAKATARVQNTRVPGMLKGKTHYLSPEQIRGETIDRRSDIFALGILMYVMVSGRHPFKADTDKQTMENIVSRDPVPLDTIVPDMNPQLDALIMRALAKDRDRRWPDCATMQRSLDQILSSTGAAVTDGDVATFIRSIMGEQRDKRRTQLTAAIQAADQRGSAEPPASRRRAAAPPARGASIEGIIPLALDGGSGSAAAAPRVPEASHVPPLLSSPPPPLVHTQRKRSVLPWLLLLLLLALGGAAGALRMGYLRAAEPWLAPRLPPPLRVLLPPGR